MFLLTYSAVSSVSHWAENKRGLARENTRGERRERQRHSVRKEPLSKQPHKVQKLPGEHEGRSRVGGISRFHCGLGLN